MVVPYAMLPIGFGALAIQFALDAVNAWRNPELPKHQHLENV
jgi:TRAP-type C4-dicarboxylate transport system permease small subunit